MDSAQAVSDTQAFITDALEKFVARQSIVVGLWADNRFAGVIGTDFRADAPTAEIGYWIGSEFEGRGRMTAATKVMIGYLLHDRGVHRIEIRCEPANKRSCAIPERLGFTYEGTLRESGKVNDRFVDHRIYSLLESEWKTTS